MMPFNCSYMLTHMPNRAHGKGVFRKQNGNAYEGEYKYDKCEGFGVYRFNNGDKYEGMWKNSLKSGQGTISWSTGRKFEGRFADDCPIIGKLTETDGKVYSVTYDGTQKFGNGAKPKSQKLIRTNSPRPSEMEAAAAELRQESSPGTTTTTDVYRSGPHSARTSTAPARKAPALPTPATSSAQAAGAARAGAAGAAATWAASEATAAGGAKASKADEWETSVAEAATVPAGGKTASDVWDLFGTDPVGSDGQPAPKVELAGRLPPAFGQRQPSNTREPCQMGCALCIKYVGGCCYCYHCHKKWDVAGGQAPGPAAASNQALNPIAAPPGGAATVAQAARPALIESMIEMSTPVPRAHSALRSLELILRARARAIERARETEEVNPSNQASKALGNNTNNMLAMAADDDDDDDDDDVDAPLAGEKSACSLCCEDGRVSTQDAAEKITDNCGHERTVCNECLARHVEAEVRSKGNFTTIKCPQSGCGAEMEHHKVQQWAIASVFETYDTLKLRAFLQKNDEFRWCSHPSCGSGQLHPAKDTFPIMSCFECKRKTCFTHSCQWHKNRTCTQYDQDAAACEEVALLQALQEGAGIKQCPKCRQGIQKSHGCDHMTCKKPAGCGFEFCWRCEAPYDGISGIRKVGNKAHQPSCIYHI